MKSILSLLACVCISAFTFAQTAIAPAQPGVTYGKAINANNAVTTAKLNKTLLKDSVYTGKIEGTVVEVCKKKGCFMKIAQENGDPIMVQFTGYSFFMPQDIAGKAVVIDGKAKVSETSVAKLKHYAADAGKSKEEIAKIKDPKRNISIMADGVLVVN